MCRIKNVSAPIDDFRINGIKFHVLFISQCDHPLINRVGNAVLAEVIAEEPPTAVYLGGVSLNDEGVFVRERAVACVEALPGYRDIDRSRDRRRLRRRLWALRTAVEEENCRKQKCHQDDCDNQLFHLSLGRM